MKKSFLFAMALVVAFAANVKAQEEIPGYSRSSLTLIMLDTDVSDTLTTADDKVLVREVYDNWVTEKFPVKYDNNMLDVKHIEESYYRAIEIDPSLSTDPKIIAGLQFQKAIEQKDIARKIVAKWFQYDGQPKADGNLFSMDLVQQRGLHNATLTDLANAEGETRAAIDVLKDEGELLLGNSYIMFTGVGFYKNEPIARLIKEAAYFAAEQAGGVAAVALKLSADVAYAATKDGWSVKANTLLYQLEWNDSIANELYAHWANTPENKQWFETTDMFKIKYLDNQSNFATVAVSIFRSKEKILTLNMNRVIANVMQKLQKQNEQFRPIFTVTQSDPYMLMDAGLKDGLSGGEQFEKVNLVMDEDGKYRYKKSGIFLTVDKKYVLNNLFDIDSKYIYDDQSMVPDTIRDKKGNVKSVRELYTLAVISTDKATQVADTTYLDVEQLRNSDKAQAKTIAAIAKSISGSDIQFDQTMVLQYTAEDSDPLYFINTTDKGWISVPQTAPDKKPLAGTVVTGAKVPVGTLLRQSTFKKIK